MRPLSLLLLSLGLASCIGPKVTVCVVDISGFQCKNQKTGKTSVVPIQEASDKNYVAMPPEDFGRVLDFMKNGCK
jgi:hypothetical protein